jgi:starch phosphorylase
MNYDVDPDALFDFHIKRIHEYKRQSLNLLETIALYLDIRDNPGGDFVPRVKILAGKAAPGYERAKLLIKLAHDLAMAIDNEPLVRGRLKLVFMPNYGVRLAEQLVPAADLSEQISTAGMEASGTGNMKLALNGALTIGTLDGANIEIRERVGADNFFLFGLTADEVARNKSENVPGEAATARSPRLKQVIDYLSDAEISPDAPGRYRALADAFLAYDPFMVATDFGAYWDTQRRIDQAWTNPEAWWRSSVMNTSRMHWFSSDRAVREYAADIWHVPVG